MQNTSLTDSRVDQFTKEFEVMIREAIDFGYCLCALEIAERDKENNKCPSSVNPSPVL
jgi:hypothetical protein